MSNNSQNPQLHVSTHPLLKHKISILRDKTQLPKTVRELVKEISLLLAYEAIGDLELESCGTLETPIASYEGERLKDRVALVPVMRAGSGMLDGLLTMLPSARVFHLGIFREKATLQPVEYYSKLPKQSNVDLCIVLDPMVATAGTSISAVSKLKEWGAKRIKLVCICASKDGLEALFSHHPDIQVYCAAVDMELNDHGYVVPGMGDVGDRLFNT